MFTWHWAVAEKRLQHVEGVVENVGGVRVGPCPQLPARVGAAYTNHTHPERKSACLDWQVGA